ncbi:MAG TPA: tetratricopeptide repeat protein [Rudaea sp.]|uniref:tetratricopeptide repeat protein n=1 Tax=Rudaea sp. TaxID=2136325 RepID=UPI002F940CB1
MLRAAMLYIGAAWALSQGVAQLLPVFGIANWIVRWFVIAAMIGFPFAMLFSWFYEWTPQGIRRESEVADDASVTRKTGKKMDRWIIVVLAVAVVLLLANTFVLHTDEKTAAARVVHAAPGKSIAVLPFLNMSGDPKNDYFSDGITEEILNALAQVPDLKVAARTSAFAFKGKNEDLRKVGRELDVSSVLEGSVQTSGAEVRITVQLIDTASGYHRWSEKYDRKLTSVFAVEDEISKTVVDKLQVQLASGDNRPLVVEGTRDPRAHDFYLRGLELLPARGPGLREAMANFEQAVAIDPGYAQAWASLSFTYSLLPGYQLSSWEDAEKQAERTAERAIALGPNLAETHLARAYLLINQMKLPAAEQEYRKALVINPGSAEAQNQLGQLLLATGRIDDAIAQERVAASLDRYSGVVHYKLGTMLSSAHQYPEAIAQLGKTLELAPGFHYARFELATVYLVTSRYADAEREMRTAAVTAGEDPEIVATIVRAIGDPSLRPQAERLLDAGVAPGDYELYGLKYAFWFSLLGAHDKAIASIQHWAAIATFGERYSGLQALALPAFDSVRNDPRFKAVLVALAASGKSDGQP